MRRRDCAEAVSGRAAATESQIRASGRPRSARIAAAPAWIAGGRPEEAARRAGFGVNLLADYCRSATLTGLVVGFGGVTDDELDRALAALVSAL